MRMFLATALVTALTVPVLVGAQQEDVQTPILIDLPFEASISGAGVPMAQPEGLTSCFDHYRFGSVEAVIEGQLTEASAGSAVDFSGVVKNENAYPVGDVAIYAKVLRERGTEEKNSNGPDVVDWFQVADGLTVPAHGSVPIEGSWDIPADARNGNYQIATFTIASNKFNFSGLSFTDDVVGPAYRFQVVSGQDGGVYFDKESANTFGYPYSFAAFPPRIPDGQANVPVSISAKNDTASPIKGSVTWRLYSWDMVGEGNLLDEKTEGIEIHPNSSSQAAYEITDTTHAVYYLVASLTTGDELKSLAGIRLVRDNVNTPRLNYVGVDTATGIATACFHSTGVAPTEDGSAKLAIYRTGFMSFLNILGPIDSISYEGRIPGDIYALTLPIDKSESFSLTASVSDGGSVADSITIPYCSEGATCRSAVSVWVYIVPILLLLLIIGFVIFKRRKAAAPVPSKPIASL